MGLDVVAREIQQPPERVADDRVARPADVYGSGRVRRGVFEHQVGPAVGEPAVPLLLCGRECVGVVALAGEDVDVGALGLDTTDVGQVVLAERVGDVRGHRRRGGAGFAGQPVGDTRREDGVDVGRRPLDAEVVGRKAQVGQRLLDGRLDFRTERTKHTLCIPAPDIGVTE